MNTYTRLAQATQTPGNGASRATDFQPLTQNPQTAPSNLQPGTQPQNPSGQEILSRENAKISVPVYSGQPEEETGPPATSINWVAVIVATVVLVFVIESWLRRREKKPIAETPVEEPAVVAHPEVPVTQLSAIDAAASEPAAVTPKPPTKTKAKTKSKRKRNR